ncbi:MAG: hypothetical protein JXA18_17520 [Chitinispirillaceae bacterium]|nr:hypothetical protein [Chitinispirillaceae bacterium]
MKKRTSIPLLLTVSLVLFIGCELFHEPVESGQNGYPPTISGTLLLPDAVSPAEGVVVTLWEQDAAAAIAGRALAKSSGAQRTVRTDGDGNFRIDSCKAGVYVIEGIGDNGIAVRIDSVAVTGDSRQSTELPPAVLQSTGAIRGEIRLDGGGGHDNVFILVLGSDRFVQVSGNGTFFMDDLPYGEYELKVVCVLMEYPVGKTIPITVLPDDTVSVGTITLEAQGICIPDNVVYTFDSLTPRMVSLQWDPCDDPEVGGYNVYRFNTWGSDWYGNSPRNKTLIVNENSFIDFVHCDSEYIYAVAAVSAFGTVGRKSPPCTVSTACLRYSIDTLHFNEGENISNLFWKEDYGIRVACVENELVRIYEYTAEREPAGRIEILLPFDNRLNIVLENDKMFLMPLKSYGDSIIYGYTLSGEALFECNVHRRIDHFDVRNDTLYVVSRDSLLYSTEAFDTTGRLLFEMGLRKGMASVFCATDGMVYTNQRETWENGIFHLMVYDADMPNGTDIPISTILPVFVDACSNYRLFLGFSITNLANDVVAQVDPPENFTPSLNNSIAINNRGEIAVIKNHYVFILLPPEQLQEQCAGGMLAVTGEVGGR